MRSAISNAAFAAFVVLGVDVVECQADVPEIDLLIQLTGSDKFSREAVQQWKSKYGAIEAEIASTPDHPWAGRYYHGDGLGVNASILIAPKGGFTFLWTGCLGVYDLNYGDVSVSKDGALQLRFTHQNVQAGYQGTASELRPMRWGQRHYLLDAKRVVAFVNSVNDGTEPRTQAHGSFFLRGGDHAKPVEGLPALPEQYARLLTDDPLVATIKELRPAISPRLLFEGISEHELRLVIDAGRERGVVEGLVFHPLGGQTLRGNGEGVVVTEVREKESEAVYRAWQFSNEKPTMPEAGWKLSTRPASVKHDPGGGTNPCDAER